MKISTDPLASCYAKEELFINRPAAEVFGRLADIANWPKWMKGVTIQKVEPPVKEGTVFVWKASGQKITSRIHTLDGPQEIGWTGQVLWIKAVHNWRF